MDAGSTTEKAEYRRAYLVRMLGAGLGGVPFVAAMSTFLPDWPWWLHSIGALLIWWATTTIVLRVWPLPAPPSP